MSRDDTPQKTTEVTWPCDKDAWKQILRRLLYSELSWGQRSVGGLKKRFKYHIKSSLSKWGIPFDRRETLARDWEEWRAVCDKRLATFEQQPIDVAEAKRGHRHQQRNPPPPTTTLQGSACTECGRVCASAFGLRSHMGRHKETRWAASSSIRRTTKRERELRFWSYSYAIKFNIFWHKAYKLDIDSQSHHSKQPLGSTVLWFGVYSR